MRHAKTHIMIIQSKMYDRMSRFDGMCSDFKFMMGYKMLRGGPRQRGEEEVMEEGSERRWCR